MEKSIPELITVEAARDTHRWVEIGRASCRERV